MSLQSWVQGYGRVWEEKDSDGVAELFTEGCVYRDQPFGETSPRARTGCGHAGPG